MHFFFRCSFSTQIWVSHFQWVILCVNNLHAVLLMQVHYSWGQKLFWASSQASGLHCLLSIRSRRTQTIVLAERCAVWMFTKPYLCPPTWLHPVPHRHLHHPAEAFPGGGGWSCEHVHHPATLGGAVATHTLSSGTGNEAPLISNISNNHKSYFISCLLENA